MSKTVYVVAHSHWDREWYFTLEDSNVLLSKNMHQLIRILEKNANYESYTFDGQISVIDEYLKAYPEDKERVKKLIEKRRLFVGPWYTQCDTLTIQTESIIRNLLFGTKGASKLGHSMQVGYLPDIFGQNQYLPSLFKGFKIPYSIFQRGVGNDKLKNGLTFYWQSPDEQHVIANHMLLGYGPGKFLSDDEQYLENTLFPMLDKLASVEKSDAILLPAGGDQVFIREHFVETIKSLNQKQNKYHFVLSNYEDYMKNCKSDHYATIENELVECQNSRIHRSIKSQRADIKQLNYDVENKVLYQLEPLLVIAKKLNIDVSRYWLERVWKQLFDVQAHDSIAGCNSDATNTQILHRLHHCNTLVEDVLNLVKKEITKGIVKETKKDNILVLFNMDIKEKNFDKDIVVFTKKPSFAIFDLDGNAISFAIQQQEEVDGGKKITVSAQGDQEVKLPSYYKSIVKLQNYIIPSFGYETLEVVEKQGMLCSSENIISCNKVENDNYVLYEEGSKLHLRNKLTNSLICDFIKFEDTKDCGDSYDYCPGESPKSIVSSKVMQCTCRSFANRQQMKCQFEVETVHHSKLFVETVFTLDEDSIHVKHTLINDVKDHRLRVYLKLQDEIVESYSDQGFSLIHRSNVDENRKQWKQLHFVEQPLPLHSLENMVVTKAKDLMNTVFLQGIKEYEVMNNDSLAFTLFRSVGVLGRDNLTTRPGRASGINNTVVVTEDAQMLKKMEFEYCISCNRSIEEIYTRLQKTRPFLFAYQNQSIDLLHERLDRFELPMASTPFPSQLHLLNFDNMEVFASTIKLSHDQHDCIIRLFNPSEKELKLTGVDWTKFTICDLSEEEVSANDTIRAKGYTTLRTKEGKV